MPGSGGKSDEQGYLLGNKSVLLIKYKEEKEEIQQRDWIILGLELGWELRLASLKTFEICAMCKY